LKNGQQRVDLQELAAASGQREIAVQKGLDWLKEMAPCITKKSIKRHSKSLRVGAKIPHDSRSWMPIETNLKRNCRYRSYYLRADTSSYYQQKILPPKKEVN